MAAIQEHAGYQFNDGICVYNRKDTAEAAKYFKLAAEQGVSRERGAATAASPPEDGGDAKQ
jgi:TPR repeat protein